MQDINIDVDKYSSGPKEEPLCNVMKIGTCRRCGHYPRELFKDTLNCIKGACFKKYALELIALDKAKKEAAKVETT